jgi:hypothetical protein
VHVDVDEGPEGRDEVRDMDPGAAVDVRGIFAGEQTDPHADTRYRLIGRRHRAFSVWPSTRRAH